MLTFSTPFTLLYYFLAPLAEVTTCLSLTLDRRRQATERADEPETVIRERFAKAKTIEGFIRNIQKRPLVLTEWDEELWLAVVDKVTVGTDGAMVFAFRNDAEVTA